MFTSYGRMEQEMDQRIAVLSAIMRVLLHSVTVLMGRFPHCTCCMYNLAADNARFTWQDYCANFWPNFALLAVVRMH